MSVKLSRRRFLQLGLAGAGAFLLVRTAYLSLAPASGENALGDASARAFFAALAPVILAGALPEDAAERRIALEETQANIGAAIDGLPPFAQKELQDLISLLDMRLARGLLAGVWSSWEEASAESISGFLSGWRASRFKLLQSAYQALHQLVYAAWYGNPRSWNLIAYAGPPKLP
jgi:hypothetical protein